MIGILFDLINSMIFPFSIVICAESVNTNTPLPASRYSYLDNSLQLVFKDTISFLYFVQRKPMRNKRSSVYPALLNQTENLGTIATIYPTCFEDQVLAIHIGQR